MTPGELIVGAVCVYLLGWAAVAAVSLIREAYAEKRADAWAEDWCATHVDPYMPDLPAPVEGEDFALWESEVREGSL